MEFTNSPLVVHTHLSPNTYGLRTKSIDTITPHIVVGHASLKNLGNLFAEKSAKASSNYGIDDAGSIAMFVEEKKASWCTSNKENDQRAITIEIASDPTYPYTITDAALRGLIELCADICKRNNIPKMLWTADKELLGKVDQQNISVHRWFANKSCPGEYLYNQLGYVADEVNKILMAPATVNTPIPIVPPIQAAGLPYLVKINTEVLRYRKGPGTNYPVTGQVRKGEIYTITEESHGIGASKWGRLKSGVGWIALDYCVKVRG